MTTLRTLALLGLLSLGSPLALADETQQIEHLMKHTWEKPGTPLDVGPVSTVEDYAIAGWTQGERGGRALLQRTAEGWRVVLCAGDSLLDSATLRDAGVPEARIGTLQGKAREAEARQPAARIRQFALFQGQVRVDAGHAHGTH